MKRDYVLTTSECKKSTNYVLMIEYHNFNHNIVYECEAQLRITVKCAGNNGSAKAIIFLKDHFPILRSLQNLLVLLTILYIIYSLHQ